ncbi:PREDICTED: protein claret segregational [Nicrophorus vespilloides]|uniref:Kinesin-like protein n=1 Tax=Nicrophorus vespilloides TaxID=110193 RepID=A0ABM1MBX6_NICVS|nr:PREDICTED: protein claret segregational [Nicrophorus vespilloides]
MENKPKTLLSKLRPPTKLISVGSSSNILRDRTQKNEVTSTLSRAIPARLAPMSRRSKSFSDLRTLCNKPLSFDRPNLRTLTKPAVKKELPKSITNATVRKPIGIQQATTSKQPIKRAANDKNSDEPKIKKVSKPAPYDYKARFNLLNEKYTLLIQNSKDSKGTLSTALTELEEYKTKYESTNNLAVNLQQAKNLLTKRAEEAENDLKKLKEEHEKVSREFKTLREKYDIIDKEHTEIMVKYEKEGRELKVYKSNLETANENICNLENSVQTFKQDLLASEQTRRYLHNKIQDLKGNIRVFCRVRPPKDSEDDRMITNMTFIDESTLEIKKQKESISAITGKCADLKQEFNFDKVFPPESSQEEVFEDLSQLVQSALDGYNICVFAYGQTGSGKTYTMQGVPGDLGMIPRCVDLLFKHIQKLEKSGWVYKVEASFLEIYNETIRDLLDPNSKETHDIKYNNAKEASVTNLKIEPINGSSDLKALMLEAQNNRAVASTDYNEHSSRSHAVTKIYLEGCNEEQKYIFKASLNLVDLAGSESAKTSDRINETKNINKSLSTLGNVMLALHNKDGHIPYRNSKLTYLLQSSLGGNSKTLMFVNISPFEDCYNETVNSLRFAGKVKEVKTGSKRNKMKKDRDM